MSLSEIYRCARSLEAIENYARADAPFVEQIGGAAPPVEGPETIDYQVDETFWEWVMRPDGPPWGTEFRLYRVALSEWIARVPGLYWSKGARAMRQLANDAIEYQSRYWTTFTPGGKSQKVLGGVGTLRFPPNENGRRLVTLSGGHNASAGIPALVSLQVWEHHELGEGDIVTVRAQWQKMDLGWAERFASIKGIPMGYLVLEDPEQVEQVHDRDQPTQFHPWTVMEYSSGDAILWDFVYATADTRVERYQAKLEAFFAAYKDKHERYGRYLLSADIGEPLWEADYASPAVLRRAEPGAKAQLELIETRVRELSFRGQTIDDIVALLARNYDNVSLPRLSTQLGIPRSQVFTGGPSAQSAAQLMQKCLERDKVEELLDAIARDYPEQFTRPGVDADGTHSG